MRSEQEAIAPQDTIFSLPAVEDPPSTEVGVILMGLAVPQLLTGLGLAALADDPAAVTLLVDKVRHYGVACLHADQLIWFGARRWRVAAQALGADIDFDPVLRPAWAQAFGLVKMGAAGACGPATLVYLTACCLRSAELEQFLRHQDSHEDA